MYSPIRPGAALPSSTAMKHRRGESSGACDEISPPWTAPSVGRAGASQPLDLVVAPIATDRDRAAHRLDPVVAVVDRPGRRGAECAGPAQRLDLVVARVGDPRPRREAGQRRGDQG